jgi:hypothetical protein
LRLARGGLYAVLNNYILDVAGILLALAAYAVFLRPFPSDRIPDLDRQLAPVFAIVTMGIVGLGVACFWVAYRLNGLA